VEESKGVLDIAEIAKLLRRSCHVPVIFHICGSGSALPELQRRIYLERLADDIIIHGRMERDDLLYLYSNSHAVIVPTRSTFTEGMPMVCAEAMLSGLPVITNRVTNAGDVMSTAIVQARTDDPASYAEEITKIATNVEVYDHLKSECGRYATQFLNPSFGYAAAINNLLEALEKR
jgi:glycogen synthase